jgi:hypothetical protein
MSNAAQAGMARSVLFCTLEYTPEVGVIAFWNPLTMHHLLWRSRAAWPGALHIRVHHFRNLAKVIIANASPDNLLRPNGELLPIIPCWRWRRSCCCSRCCCWRCSCCCSCCCCCCPLPSPLLILLLPCKGRPMPPVPVLRGHGAAPQQLDGARHAVVQIAVQIAAEHEARGAAAQ